MASQPTVMRRPTPMAQQATLNSFRSSTLNMLSTTRVQALCFWDLSLATIWSGFGGLSETTNGGEPIVLYDKAAGRWLVSQLAYAPHFTDNLQCIAVSTTSDATGSYNRYAYDFGGNLPDYPKLGIWPDAYCRHVHKCRYISIAAGAGANLLGVRVGRSCGIADLKVCVSPIARMIDD